jgi:hypothetical protein
MRTVLFAAASTLCLAFAAHSAPIHHMRTHHATNQSAVGAELAQPLASVAPPGANCLEGGASLSHTAYTTDDDAECCSNAAYCSQYLSTQIRPRKAAPDRTRLKPQIAAWLNPIDCAAPALNNPRPRCI